MAEAVGHSRQSIPKRFRAFRSILYQACHSLRFVAELTGPLASADDLKRSLVPPAVDRPPTAGGWAKQKSPSLISMAARVRMPGQLHDARGSQGSQTAKRRAAGAALTAAGPS